MNRWFEAWSPLVQAPVAAAGAIILGLVFHFLFWGAVQALVGRTRGTFDDSLPKHCRKPTSLVFPALLMQSLLPLIAQPLPAPLAGVLTHTLRIVLILSIAWLLIRLGNVLEDVLLHQYRLDQADNLRARQVHTQVQIIKRIIAIIVGILALGAVLMSYEGVRQLGTGLLASAGLAGLIIGLAAQRTLSNLLAGIQLAFTQPIRLDDVVIVEGEWGWVEEITLTYVVVRIWDLRRLVLPIGYFLEKPFQNWTRRTADILGTVYLYMDYTVPVDAIRQELQRVVEGNNRWDGKVASVVVTNATEHSVEVRALVSSVDSGQNWDLRCEVREKLIDFIRRDYPDALPRTRWEPNHPSSAAAPDSS